MHTSLQKKVLPQLLKLFPKVQFIITTHSPLFLMGMKDVFGDDDFEIYQMPDGTKINVERFSEFNRAYRYFADTSKHQEEIKKAIDQSIGCPLVVTEGATDWKHMKAALISLSQDHIYHKMLCNLKFDFLDEVIVNEIIKLGIAEYKKRQALGGVLSERKIKNRL